MWICGVGGVGVLVMVVVGVSGDLAIYVWLCGEGGMA